jgi:hypothetical protein
MKLIDNLNRRVLSEGRSYQMGFAFLKKQMKIHILQYNQLALVKTT